MEAHNHVLRSSSLVDVNETDYDNTHRFNKTGPLMTSEINTHPEDFVVLDGKPVRVKRASSASNHNNLVRSIESVESEFQTLKQSVNDSFEEEGDVQPPQQNRSRHDGIRQSKEVSRQARRIMEFESFMSNLPPSDQDEINKLIQNTSEHIQTNSRPSSAKSPRGANSSIIKRTVDVRVLKEEKGDSAEQLDQFDLNFITPKNASTSHASAPSLSAQSGHRAKSQHTAGQKQFFASPPSTQETITNTSTTTGDEHGALVLELEEPLHSDVLTFGSTAGSLSSVGSMKKKRGPPPSLAQRLALGSTERRKLHSNTSTTPSTAASGGVGAGVSSGTGAGPGTASSLARKLSSARAHTYPTSSSPAKTADGTTVGGAGIDDLFSPSSTALGASLLSNALSGAPTPVIQRPKSATVPVPVSFFWKDKQASLRSAGKQDIFLFVAHDNPQLGKTVATQLHCESPGSVKLTTGGGGGGGAGGTSSSKHSSGMFCMLECKDKCTPVNVHFILGKIVFSGEYAAVEGADAVQPRGSACLVVTELRAVRGDIKKLKTQQLKSDIIEVDLVNLPEGFSVPLRNEEDLRALLRPCTAHVDMILDPYHTSHQWYPYWEGARRMAPQFRSKGIGYLRLGDDMSQYGSAFLSLDAGASYLDEGATAIVAAQQGASNAPSPYCTTLGNNLRLSRTFSGSSGIGGGSGAATPGASAAGQFAHTVGSTGGGSSSGGVGGSSGKLMLSRASSFGRSTSSELSSPSSQHSQNSHSQYMAASSRMTSDEVENLCSNTNANASVGGGGGASGLVGKAKLSPRSPRAVGGPTAAGGSKKVVTYEASANMSDGARRSPRGDNQSTGTPTSARGSVVTGGSSGGSSGSGANSGTNSGTTTPRSLTSTTPSTTSSHTTAGPGTTTSFLKKTSSSHSMKVPVKEDPAWEQSLGLIRECTHAMKSGDTLKWAERVEIMQKLAYAMREILFFASIESFVAAHNGLVCEVISLLTDSLIKQNNPHVLVATVACIRTIEYGTLLVAQCWLPFRALLMQVMHTLRSTNKLVQESTHECLLHLYRCRSITFAGLCNGNLLYDIIVGTHGTSSSNNKKGITKTSVASGAAASAGTGGGSGGVGGGTGAGASSGASSSSTNTKITTAANTTKVVQWMEAAAQVEVENCLTQCVAAGTFSGNTASSPGATRVDSQTIVKHCTALLSHREETTREATILFITALLIVDILQNLVVLQQQQQQQQGAEGGLAALLALSRRLSDLQRKTTSVVTATTTATTSEAENKQKVIEQAVSERMLPLLVEIRGVSARSYDKIVQLLAQGVSKHALNAAVANAAKIADTATVLSARSALSTLTTTTTGTVNTATTTTAALSAVSSGASSSRSDLLSPRTTVVKISSPRAFNGKIEALKASPRTLGADVKSASNASTPPYSYQLGASNSAITPLSTPRDVVGPVNNSSSEGGGGASGGSSGGSSGGGGGSLSPATVLTTKQFPTAAAAAAVAEIDIRKMQQGLQGIKNIRARSANGSRGTSASTVGTADNTISDTGSSVSSRAGSAVRSRRRIAHASAVGTEPNGVTSVDSPVSSGDSGSGSKSLGAESSAEKGVVQRVGEMLTPRRLSRDYSGSGLALGASGDGVRTPRAGTGGGEPPSTTTTAASSRPSSGRRSTAAASVATPLCSPRHNGSSSGGSSSCNSGGTSSSSKITAAVTGGSEGTSSSDCVGEDATTEKALQNLGGAWYEAKLLLRKVPTSESSWEHLSQVIKSAPAFFADLSALSAACQYPKGAILRYVLPFDEDTSSNDQAKGRVLIGAEKDASSTVSTAVALGSSSVPSPLKGRDPQLRQLAQSAVELRSVIRVKMADEADFNQAATACTMLNKFLCSVDTVSSQSGLSSLQIINRLETMS